MKSWCHTLLFCSLTWMKGQIIFLPYHTTQQIVLSCTCGLKQDGCCRQSCERLLPSSHWPVSHTEYLNLEIPAVNNWLLHRKSEMLLISVTVFKSGMWYFLISPGFAVSVVYKPEAREGKNDLLSMAELLLYNKATSLYKCAHLADTGVNRAGNTFTMYCPSFIAIT